MWPGLDQSWWSSVTIVGAMLLTLLAAWEMYASPGLFLVSLGVWVVAALVIGALLRAWWSLLLACVPWPLQIAVGLATGRYLFLGEAWEAAAAITVLSGLMGISIGVALGRWLVVRLTPADRQALDGSPHG